MPTTFTPGDNKQEDKLNPGQQDYDRRFNDIAQAEEKAAFDSIANNYDQTADSGQEDENIERARMAEQEAQGAPGASWADRTAPQPVTSGSRKFITNITLKRAAPLLGIGGIIGIIIFLLGGWLPTMLLPSLSMGAVAENDARGTLLERRLVAKLQQKMTDNGPCDTKLSLCRNTKMPKIMLSTMAKKGIVAVDANGNPIDVDGTGYMETNPTHYKYTTQQGEEKIIAANKFVDEYRNNASFRKTFKNAYNTRYMSYTGGFMKKILNKWGAKKDGGVMADPEFTEETAKEKVSALTKVGGEGSTDSAAKQTFKERAKLLFQRSADKVKKTGGDPILLVGTGVCMGIAMPTFAAGTIRAIQLAQVVALTSNFILSASDMLRANEAKPEQMSALGKTLTDRYKVEGEDTMKAAVDSSVLLAATGAATGAMLKPSKYTPGYSLYSNPAIQASSQIANNPGVKQTCNMINSPQAAVASAGITAAAGAATGGVAAAVKVALQAMGKVLIAIGAIEAIMLLLEQTGALDMIAEGAFGLVAGLLGNIYEDAEGVELGDALGAGLFATFSLAALGGGAAVLTKSQARGFSAISAQVDNEYREEAIATLSPFDISSQYTFLGSIVSKLAISSAGSGSMVSSTISTLGSILRSPFQAFDTSASAQVDPIEAKYGYASYFGVEEDIAVTIAGTPGVGMPVEYVDMNPSTAEDLVAGSFDPLTGEPYQPNAIFGDTGAITGQNADIATTIADCADADLESMSGCTIASSTTTTASSTSCGGDAGANCDTDDSGSLSTSSVTVEGDVSAQESAAQRIYFMDHQLENILSGNDEEETTASTTSTAGAAIDRDKLWEESVSVACAPGTTFVRDDRGFNQGTEFAIKLCAIPNTEEHGSPMLINSRASGAVLAMIEKMRADLSLSVVKIASTFRTMSAQEHAWNCNQGNPYGEDCSDIAGRAAKPGYSNHQSGYAIDFQLPSGNSGATKPGDAYWDWLNKNAATYGFSSNVGESWHWSVTGG